MSEVDGVVMGLRHVALPIEGVQFHPESVLTPDGPHLLANFLRLAGEGEASRLDAATGSFATAGLAEAGRRRAGPMSDLVRAALGGDRRGRHALDGRGARRDGRGHGRRGDAGPAGRPAHGPADARRDRRRAGRLRDRDARAGRPRRGARRRHRRRRHRRRRQRDVQHLDDRGARRGRGRCARWPSTATGRSRRRRARRTSSTRSGSGSTTTRRRPGPRCASTASPSCSRPTSTRRCSHAGPTRREIGVRTAFNLLGPLTNPAGTPATAARRGGSGGGGRGWPRSSGVSAPSGPS